MQPSDQELLERIGQKDPDALSVLYDRYNKVVFGLLLTMLRDTDNAEDVLQEVFTQVWRKADSYDPALGQPKNWLLRIAHNRAINLIRANRNRRKDTEVSLSNDVGLVQAEQYARVDGEEIVGQVSSFEESKYVATALTALPEEQRLLIDLAFFKGYSHSEIAEMTAIPLGTIKTRIRSGIKTLRNQLNFLKDESL
jgi:RNA polymerase sigma-70 factor (ECF subfamily)